MFQRGKVKIKVPASTSNLGPGFDALGLALNLYNYLELEVKESGLEINLEGEGEGKIPEDPENIAYRAIAELCKQIGLEEVPGLRLRLKNNIPISRGLGSSGATRIAALIAARELFNCNIDDQLILNISVGLEGHTGNSSPAFYGGFVAYGKAGGNVKAVPLSYPAELKAVLVIPKLKLETSKARSVLPEKLPYKDAVFNICRTSLLIGALANRNWDYVKTGMEDRLHQKYREGLLPGASDVLRAAYENGADGAAWSGAGTGIIALARKDFKSIGSAMVDQFSNSGIDSYYRILSMEPEGARIID